MANYVWQFTNQRKLTKKEFISYIERKIFKTIRQSGMLPSDKEIKISRRRDLNAMVLKYVLEKKFKVKVSPNPNFSSENLSEVAEEIFRNILEGKFEGPLPKDKISRPLYYVSDAELELYAKLVGIKGKLRKKDDKIRRLFEKFLKKNQDLEINIVKTISQISTLD